MFWSENLSYCYPNENNKDQPAFYMIAREGVKARVRDQSPDLMPLSQRAPIRLDQKEALQWAATHIHTYTSTQIAILERMSAVHL